MSGQSLISADILASYAADAAREVPGVSGLVGSALHRHDGVRVSLAEGRVGVEVHLALAWGASAPEVGAEVQERVADYLAQMADVRPDAVDVVVDEFTPKR
ncbi:MAG TPA: Asp23/Gls24 family envelope stress response protein [Gaiellaceae bacterium]|nr:Asp23/Gls24 family envelope stress response protein [Gaiellaceae bacterium]